MVELENGSLVGFDLTTRTRFDESEASLVQLFETFRSGRNLPAPGSPLSLSMGEDALMDPVLGKRLKDFLRDIGRVPDSLCLFFSDQLCLRHGVVSLDKLLRLKAGGYRIGLDIECLDTAPGAFLEMLPADVLRIGPLDARPQVNEGTGTASLKNFVRFCSNLLMTPAARGVDDAVQMGVLRDAGVRIGQGHFFCGNQ